MTTTRRTRRGLLALLALGGLSSSCISQATLSNLGSNMRPDAVLMSPQVLGLIGQGQRIGATLLGAMVVILALVCWYRAQQGMAFVGLIKEWLLGAGLALYIITTIGQGDLSAVLWIYKAGQFLGATFTPPQGYWAANHDIAVGKLAALLEDILKAPGGTFSLDATLATLEGFLTIFLNPIAVVGVVFNGIAIHLFKLVLQVSFTFLLVFYWTLTPLVAPMLVLPQTRHVFLGWVKSYISIALWPFFFAIVEQISIAIPWSTWLSADTIAGLSAPQAVSTWVQGQIMLLVLNIGFLAVYASIPVVSNRIVNGAAQPFRGGLL